MSNPSKSRPRVATAIPWWGFAATLVSGCGQGAETGPVCYPVRGEVLFRDAPVAEAMVVFHPLDATAPAVQRPLGITDAEGRFSLTTFRTNDGAPAGRYAITVERRELVADGDEMVRNGRNLLPPKYASPRTSEF
jgi:hypothetical protein